MNVPILGYGSESAEWLYNSATMTLEVWIAVMLSGIAILVTLLGLVLPVFAIGVGFAAYWGYFGLKEEARKVATEAANKKLSEYFENEALKDKIRLMMVSASVVPGVSAAQPAGGERIYEEGGDDNASNSVR